MMWVWRSESVVLPREKKLEVDIEGRLRRRFSSGECVFLVKSLIEHDGYFAQWILVREYLRLAMAVDNSEGINLIY